LKVCSGALFPIVLLGSHRSLSHYLLQRLAGLLLPPFPRPQFSIERAQYLHTYRQAFYDCRPSDRPIFFFHLLQATWSRLLPFPTNWQANSYVLLRTEFLGAKPTTLHPHNTYKSQIALPNQNIQNGDTGCSWSGVSWMIFQYPISVLNLSGPDVWLLTHARSCSCRCSSEWDGRDITDARGFSSDSLRQHFLLSEILRGRGKKKKVEGAVQY
jgi:hypothetical protein